MFEGLDNFRDFGGYPTADGRALRRGLLFRSAHHGNLTDADLVVLAEHDIATIVDLRRPLERRRTPSRRWPGWSGQVIDNDIGDMAEDPWLTFIRETEVLSPQVMRASMIDYYRDAPLQERHLDLFSRYFAALEETPGAVLVHCAAGKDRTGLLVALTHHLAGVPDETILHDYLLTNTATDAPGKVAQIARWIGTQTGRTLAPEAILAALYVESHHLETGFAAMKAAFGSVDGYLHDALGVTARRKTAILERLLA